METRPLSLRPVEQLFLLAFVGHEDWTTPNALAAVITFFLSRGLIAISDQEISITESGENCLLKERILSGYEVLALNAIRGQEPASLADALDNNVIKKDLTLKGFLESKPRFSNISKSFPFLGEYFKCSRLSAAGEKVVSDLLIKRKALNALSRADQLKDVSLAIFPSIFRANEQESENKSDNHIIGSYAWVAAFESAAILLQPLPGIASAY